MDDQVYRRSLVGLIALISILSRTGHVGLVILLSLLDLSRIFAAGELVGVLDLVALLDGLVHLLLSPIDAVAFHGLLQNEPVLETLDRLSLILVDLLLPQLLKLGDTFLQGRSEDGHVFELLLSHGELVVDLGESSGLLVEDEFQLVDFLGESRVGVRDDRKIDEEAVGVDTSVLSDGVSLDGAHFDGGFAEQLSE